MGEANVRGYELADFADGFSRYIPNPSLTTQLQRTSDVASNNLL
jgi:hypothetical protein